MIELFRGAPTDRWCSRFCSKLCGRVDQNLPEVSNCDQTLAIGCKMLASVLRRFDKFGKVVCQTARRRSIYPQPSHPRVAYQKHQQEIIPKISPWEPACCSVLSEKWKPCDSRVRHRISTAEIAHGLLWTEDVWCLCFSRIVIDAWMSSLRK